ncbi:hypothetical protein [Luteibacter sp.]|uniref:hypothetical protein n=1 Tax=Luteibacter sp. TaxID=1886636 RepID=UPI003F80C94D
MTEKVNRRTQADASTTTAAEDHAVPNAASLSFAELNRRLSAIPDYDAPAPNARKWPRVCQFVSLVAYVATLGVARLPLDEKAHVVLMLLLLTIEITGVAASFWFSRGEFISLIRPFEDYARQLDHDYPYHFEIRDWLAGQPRDTLEKHAAMPKYRRERFTQRLPLLAGGISTLGIIPVLVAVYFQGRQILEGHSITWIDWFFGFALLLFYWLTWTSSLTKSRMDAMDMYLQDALAEAKASDPVATPQ